MNQTTKDREHSVTLKELRAERTQRISEIERERRSGRMTYAQADALVADAVRTYDREFDRLFYVDNHGSIKEV